MNGSCQGDADSKLLVAQDATGFTVVYRTGPMERYDSTGRLLQQIDSSGRQTSYTYGTSNQLETVTGPFGHIVFLRYNAAGRLSQIDLPGGQTIAYDYIAAGSNQNFVGVRYPDGSAKRYHYENAAFPNHLTGISYVEANGSVTRYATYSYDTTGKAISTEHAGGVERFTLSYDSDTQTTVRDAVSNAEVMTFSPNLGIKNLVSKVNGADGKSLTQTFDANNNLTCKKDEEGRVTSYTYNAANQKLSVTEGLTGTCAAPQTTSATRSTRYSYASPTLDARD